MSAEKQLIISIDKDLKKNFIKACIDDDISIKKKMTQLIQKYLKERK